MFDIPGWHACGGEPGFLLRTELFDRIILGGGQSTGSISIRRTLLGVPKQFLYIDITYDDPALPVTSSTASVRVPRTIAARLAQ